MLPDSVLDYARAGFARQVAALLGDLTYVPDEPCVRGHTERWVKTGKCVACLRAASERWRARNLDRYNQNGLRWRRANPEKSAAIEKRYAQKHPHRNRVKCHRRKSRKLNAPGKWTPEEVRLLLQLQGGHCAYCDETQGLHLDHVIPLSRGGSNWPWNLQWLCAHHNVSKGTRTDREYRVIAGLPPVPCHKSVIFYFLRFGV